jgi:hypothetical protein
MEPVKRLKFDQLTRYISRINRQMLYCPYLSKPKDTVLKKVGHNALTYNT